MVQTYSSPVRVYKVPFELLMKAYEKRFPTSPLIPIFLECDVIKESQTEDGAEHIVERRCKLAIDVPWMLKKLVGIDYAIFTQKNALDRKNRRLLIEARNESFVSRVSIYERCVYSVHPDNPDWTCFEQEACLDVKSFFGFESTVEKIAVRTYSSEIARAKETLMIFLKQLEEEGVTRVEKWTPPGQKDPAWGPPETQVPPSAWGDRRDDGEENLPDDAEDKVTAVSAVKTTATCVTNGVDSANPSNNNNNNNKSKDPATSSGTTATSGVPENRTKKLEVDYIERCLGALTDSQASALVQLKDRLQKRHQGKLPSDSHALRFLRAREFNVDKAEDMILKTLLWRKEFNVDSLSATYNAPELIVHHIPGAWFRHDAEGRPVFHFRLGVADVKGVMRALGGEEPMLRHLAWLIEEGMQRCLEATAERGTPVSTVTCILDLEGLSMRHLWRPGIRTLIKLIELMEANYPETLGSLILVRAPRIFPPLWTLIYPCLDVNTRRKCVIYDESQDPVDALVHKGRHLDDETFVPEFLGGKGVLEIPAGGLVPKETVLQMQRQLQQQHSSTTGEEGDEENILFPATGFNSIYDRVTLLKGFPHEVAHSFYVDDENDAAKPPKKGAAAVLTWDFDVIKGDVEFAVYYAPKRRNCFRGDLEDSDDAALPGCGAIIGSYGDMRLDVGSPGEGSKQIMSKGRFGVADECGGGVSGSCGVAEWKRLEDTARIYRERDSVQGSLEVTEPGCYVIQWENVEKQKSPMGPFDFPALAAASKAKVMVFTELIDPPSEEIHGSIASFSLVKA